MHCPKCGTDNTQVKDSRPAESGLSIRRRRICTHCTHRFTTYERIQLQELTVIKRNGERVPFNSEKLARSIRIATRKRPIQADIVEKEVFHIIQELENRNELEISTQIIGETTMNALAKLDTVAYVRFASVYKNFEEARDFESFIAALRPQET